MSNGRFGGRLRSLVYAFYSTCAVIAFLATGCAAQPQSDLRRELLLAREQIARQGDELAAREETIRTLEQRIDSIRAISPDDLKKTFHPTSVEIASLSGGYNDDGKPGDDGVVVYLRPLDDDGDVLKAAGEIRIQLYDLSASPGSTLIGEYVFPVEDARKLWYGKLMTQHYTLHCPWKHGPPKSTELTVRATFVDYLTQRVISTQRPVTVKLPG